MTEVSVIISTYNGRNKIIQTLRALEAQDYTLFETIVVIDGSTDGTYEFLEGQFLDLKLKLFNQENQGRAMVRNKGAELAQGDIIVFYDDDMSPEPDSVLRHVQFHKKYKKSICGGNQLENEKDAINDFDRYRCSLRGKWLKKYNQDISKIDYDNLFLTAANFSIYKDDFIKIGSFDPSLNDAEDLEFSYRALNNGYSVFFDRLNIAWHDDFVSCERYINRRRQYLSAYQKLNEMVPKLITDRMIKLNTFKRFIFSIMSHKYWVNLVDGGYLKQLPIFIKYKMYDIIVTGLGSVYINRSI